MDTLLSMKVFVRVVSEGSFARAAERMRLSRAVVTKHVMSLEERLRTRLLNRTTRKLSLTETGRTYFEHCRASSASWSARKRRSPSSTPRRAARYASARACPSARCTWPLRSAST